MILETARKEFRELQAKIHAYAHACGVLSYDGVTGAPSRSADGRAETIGVLASVLYDLNTSPRTLEILACLKENASSLTDLEKREVEVFSRELEFTSSIPKDEYTAYQELVVRADAVWHQAKLDSDFASFEPLLKDVFDTNVRFARYFKPDKKPYDVMLNMYERGLSCETADAFFAAVRKELVPLIKDVCSRKAPEKKLGTGYYSIEKQRVLSDRVMAIMGIDRARCSIGETEHPFTTNFNLNDVRITTHYLEHDLTSSLFSVIHEGGHALYELGGGADYEKTVLSGGVSMGFHESQSRMFENIIGRSPEFVSVLYPVVREIFPEETNGVSEYDMLREFNRAECSLIRTEADELTYPMHIMLRYDLERAVTDGDLAVHDLPAAWAEKTREYLGIEVPDDKRGVLQDSHWSGGMIGYFPSYALGSAYAAQFMDKMRREIPVDRIISSGDLTGITQWLTDKIYRHSGRYDPNVLFGMAVGAPFDPHYYTDYLKNKFTSLYQL